MPASEVRRPRRAGRADAEGKGRTVVIATTTPALGAGLSAWFGETELWHVGQVVSNRAELEAALAGNVALLVASACLDGELVAAMAARMSRQVPLLVLVSDPDAQVEADFLRAGASAVLGVKTSREELLAVGLSLTVGRSVASGEAIRLLAEGIDPLPRFTERQHAILCALAEGRSTREIADDLVLTPSTVKTHIGRLATRLGLSGRQELESIAGQLVGLRNPSRRRPAVAPGTP